MDPLACDSDRYRDALRYLYERINYERLAGGGTSRYPFRLQRVTDLMRLLQLERYLYADSPQPKVPLDSHRGDQGEGIGRRHGRRGADRLRMANRPLHVTASASTWRNDSGSTASPARRPI